MQSNLLWTWFLILPVTLSLKSLLIFGSVLIWHSYWPGKKKSSEHFKMLKDSLWLRFFNLSDLSVYSLHFLSDLHQTSIKQNGQYFVLFPRLSWIASLTKYRQGSPESASVADFIDRRQTSWSSRWVQLNLKQGNTQTLVKIQLVCHLLSAV